MPRPERTAAPAACSRRAPHCAAILLSLLVLPAGPASATDVVGEARAAAEAGDTAGALERLSRWLEQNPGDRDALFARAQALAWSGDYAASRRAYDALLAEEPRNADYLFGRAQAWLWGGEPGRALEDIRAARAVAPDYAALGGLEQQALAALPPAAMATPAPPRRIGEAAAEASLEDLDRGYDDWRSLAARVRFAVSPTLELRGSIAEVTRYGRDESEAGAGAGWAAGNGWTIGADVTAAGNAQFLPEWSAQAQFAGPLAAATTLQASYRRAEYRNTASDTFSLGVDRYVSRYRLAYTLFRGEPADASGTWTHVFRCDRYYGESNSVGLQFTTGEESESDGAGGLLVSRVEAVALIGRHAVTADWTLTWAATWHEQGDLYRRAGAHVGIARRF
jgi:YaiO family outer membrane protein